MSKIDSEAWLQEVERYSEEDGLFCEQLPYSESLRRFWIPEGGIYEDTFRTLDLDRLQQIRCLTSLTYRHPRLPVGKDVVYLTYNHTRLDHVMVVGFLMETVLKRNGFSQEDVNLGVMAGLTHDFTTPALGDAVMAVDPGNLSEEKTYRKIMEQKGQGLLEKYGINISDLEDAVLGVGLVGRILDKLDRITYVLKDMNRVIGHPSLIRKYPPITALDRIARSKPLLGEIYQDIVIDQQSEQVYFTNLQRLGRFLKARAMLHRDVYLNPVSQGRDMFWTKAVSRLYTTGEPSSDRPLTPDRLREMGDEELVGLLCNYYRVSWYQLSYSTVDWWFPQYNQFNNEEDAWMFEGDLRNRSDIGVLGVKRIRPFNSATGYLVINARGEIVPFSKASPRLALEINDISNSVAGIYVYWDFLGDSNKFNTALQSALV